MDDKNLPVKLPFNDELFDMVFCCDVLDHVEDIGMVVSEISRVLRPGGLFFFDTINRTMICRIDVIYFMQECRFTSFAHANCHVWTMFIKPEKLRLVPARNDIVLNGLKGINHKKNGISVLMDMYRVSQKLISDEKQSRRMDFFEGGDLSCSYMGYGIKNAIDR